MDTIKQSQYWDKVLKPINLELGQEYDFGGTSWIVAEKPSSNYVVIQSNKGVDSIAWPGFTMNGGAYYGYNIDGQNVSNYSTRATNLYNVIKSAEYNYATYGKGLYLISNAKCGTTTIGSEGSGLYCEALASAATHGDDFGVTVEHVSISMLGTVNSSTRKNMWYVGSNGFLHNNGGQHVSCVFAPAFNLDLRLIKVNGNTIQLL